MTNPPASDLELLAVRMARMLRHGPERAKAALLLVLFALAGGLGLAGLAGVEGERPGAATSSAAASRTTTGSPQALLAAAPAAELPALPPSGGGTGHAFLPSLPLPALLLATLILLSGLGFLPPARPIRTGPRQPTGPPAARSR